MPQAATSSGKGCCWTILILVGPLLFAAQFGAVIYMAASGIEIPTLPMTLGLAASAKLTLWSFLSLSPPAVRKDLLHSLAFDRLTDFVRGWLNRQNSG